MTAEEKGLGGSDYFATRPTISRDRIVANVNVDMPLLRFRVQPLVAFGQHRNNTHVSPGRM